MQDLKVTIIQSDIVNENPEQNHRIFGKKIDNIGKNPDLIILPEMFNTGFPVDPEKYAEEIDGESVHFLLKKATEKNCAIAASVVLKHEQNFTNDFIWMNPDGTFETYSKRHVFGLGEESEFITPGRDKLIMNYKGWNICPLVCYDLRFPVWSKNTYKNGDYEYDLLIYIANWPEIRNYPWKQLLIARAIENQSYVIGVNRVGIGKNGDNHSGDSMIIDPEGKVMFTPKSGEEIIKTLILSASDLQEHRTRFAVGPDWDDFEIEV